MCSHKEYPQREAINYLNKMIAHDTIVLVSKKVDSKLAPSVDTIDARALTRTL